MVCMIANQLGHGHKAASGLLNVLDSGNTFYSVTCTVFMLVQRQLVQRQLSACTTALFRLKVALSRKEHHRSGPKLRCRSVVVSSEYEPISSTTAFPKKRLLHSQPRCCTLTCTVVASSCGTIARLHTIPRRRCTTKHGDPHDSQWTDS